MIQKGLGCGLVGRWYTHLRPNAWYLMLRHFSSPLFFQHVSFLPRGKISLGNGNTWPMESEQAGLCVNLASAFLFLGAVFSSNLSLIVREMLWLAFKVSISKWLYFGGHSLSPVYSLQKGPITGNHFCSAFYSIASQTLMCMGIPWGSS